MASKLKTKLLSRRKAVRRVVVKERLEFAKTMTITLYRRDGSVEGWAKRYPNTEDGRRQRAYDRLSRRVGPDRAQRLMTMSNGVEHVVAHNRQRTPEQRRREYQDDEFVEI
ncbi:hypothetical protein [Halomonas sp. JS92-SW72]|uniref:hypothetical protein n=1 Tax=Halomonas sp. JS92-SW72 TaxID=2306583 RepID=UPI000E5AC779|nr:hypothetical protein [Halomonas sp. JS92-SW72]AXY42499.1 hypothetical protein D1793_09935 [Halomonas sp. JS92-SW72]